MDSLKGPWREDCCNAGRCEWLDEHAARYRWHDENMEFVNEAQKNADMWAAAKLEAPL